MSSASDGAGWVHGSTAVACAAALAGAACSGALGSTPGGGPGAGDAGATTTGDGGHAGTTSGSGTGGATGRGGAAQGGAAQGGAGGGAVSQVRFAVIGDFGADGSAEKRVADLVRGWSPDFVLTVGDDNYPAGAASTIDANIGKHYASFIGNYHGAYGPGSDANRFWPIPGNHDWMASGLAPYLDYFDLPGNERYYDVDFGLVRVFALDSDPNEPDGFDAASKQAKWLEPRLSASKACYDVVTLHHAPYSSAYHGSTKKLRWPFEAWGADVVMAGHDHTYERLEVGGIPYFVNGLGGASIYQFNAALPESKVRFNDRHGAMLVTATRESITYRFDDDQGNTVDEHTVVKICP